MSREELVEALMAEHEYALGYKRGSICTCGHVPTVEPESLRTQQDYHRVHLAQAILDSPAFRTILADERAAALREAADDPALRLSGHSGISIRRLRDRADEVTR